MVEPYTQEVHGRICLFCHKDSSGSSGVEHVLPESLGNTTLVLPPGIVCDACNNYFARKVEGPLLGSDPLLSLRHFENIPNKRGGIPPLIVPTSLGPAGRLWVPPSGPFPRVLTLPEAESHEVFREATRFEIAVPDPDALTNDVLLGRFTCKVALEAMAARCFSEPLTYDSLLTSDELTDCRLHARYGTGSLWPVRINRIYGPRRAWDDNGCRLQRVWEHDFLVTPQGQVIFAIAIFGLELAINVLERDTDAYNNWLSTSRAPSLLYPSGLPVEPGQTEGVSCTHPSFWRD